MSSAGVQAEAPGLSPEDLQDATPASIQVSLQGISGNHVQLEAAPDSTVGELKDRVASLVRIPSVCQKLVQGVTLLADGDLLGSVCHPKTLVLEATIVISLDAVVADLERCKKGKHGLWRRIRGLETLKQLGRNGGEYAITSVMKCLDNDDELVRNAALDALPSVAHPGDQNAINAAAMSLEDPDTAVRKQSVQALVAMASDHRGDGLAAVRPRFSHPQASVRIAAIEASSKLFERGDESAVSEITALLSDGDGDVRACASDALARLVGLGNSRAVAALAACLDDDEQQVRCAALEALEVLARGGNATAAKALMAKSF